MTTSSDAVRAAPAVVPTTVQRAPMAPAETPTLDPSAVITTRRLVAPPHRRRRCRRDGRSPGRPRPLRVHGRRTTDPRRTRNAICLAGERVWPPGRDLVQLDRATRRRRTGHRIRASHGGRRRRGPRLAHRHQVPGRQLRHGSSAGDEHLAPRSRRRPEPAERTHPPGTPGFTDRAGRIGLHATGRLDDDGETIWTSASET